MIVDVVLQVECVSRVDLVRGVILTFVLLADAQKSVLRSFNCAESFVVVAGVAAAVAVTTAAAAMANAAPGATVATGLASVPRSSTDLLWRRLDVATWFTPLGPVTRGKAAIEKA